MPRPLLPCGTRRTPTARKLMWRSTAGWRSTPKTSFCLAQLAQTLGTPTHPVEDAGPTALLQIINQLRPVVIVDESHHARSTLSKQMLRDFNPRFVLDLTATPRYL